MLFHSTTFLAFWLVTLLFAAATQGSLRWQLRGLMAASCVFYMWWSPLLIIPILVSCGIDYFVALRIEAVADASAKRRWLLVSLISNLGLLGTFKYLDFALESAEWLGRLIDPSLTVPRAHLVLPVGISFYTFQTLSYTIDVYRGALPAMRSPVAFSMFVTFFPQLVAGPIVRAVDFLPQLERPARVVAENLRRGVPLFYVGLVKKVVFADNVAPYVDRIYGAPATAAPAEIIWATVLFSVQIYCDFSGYTDMAIGVARTFGYEFIPNFNYPYLARSIREFWRRWHMSLSTWLRDYLYIPLGGSRHGARRTTFALLMTMLLGGLWHGASWNFVLWGAYHGALLAISNAVSRRAPPAWTRPGLAVAALQHAVTLLWVLFGWALFRAQRADQLTAVLRAFTSPGAWRGLGAALPEPRLVGVVATFVVVHVISAHVGGLGRRLGAAPLWLAGAVSAAALLAVALLWPATPSPFVYFQF